MKYPFHLTIRDAVATEATLLACARSFEEEACEHDRMHLYRLAEVRRRDAAEARRLAVIVAEAIVETTRESA